MRTSSKIAGMMIVACAAAAGCDSPAEERAEERAEALGLPEAVEERMEERAEERAEQQAAAPTRVRPAVTITAIAIECPATPVFFDRDSAQLGDDDRESLSTLADCLQGTATGERVRIVGMASPPGSEDYNQQLAEQRATNVASFLRQEGVEEGRFRITAIGEDGAVEGMPELYPTQRAALAIPRTPGAMPEGAEQPEPSELREAVEEAK
ncbi:MAG: OmpA family protein [Myxococcota bacterium]|nr:OmpA family protein [Myxococcota bacterium]